MGWEGKRIVANSYKEWHEELQQIIETSNAEKAAKSEEERKAEAIRDRDEVNELIRRVNNNRGRILMIPRCIRRMLFEALCRKISIHAEDVPVDLTIE